MTKTARERITGLKKLLIETQALPEEQIGKKDIELLLKKNIRTEEMALYRRFYFEKGCYFGLLLIQSQVFENQIRKLISSCELFIQKSNSSFKTYNYKTSLEEMTLGALVLKPLSYYLDYEKLLTSIKNFNAFRKRIIHHLTDSYDTELSELEREIATSYIVNDYAKIENMILEASTRINYRVAQITAPNSEIIEHIRKTMKTIIDLENENIVFRFDS